MSGGRLTDHQYDHFRLNDWAEEIDKVNILLAEQMRDMCDLLDTYDRYLSGDCGKDVTEKAWSEYRDKWIKIDADQVVEILLEKCREIVNGAIKGCRDGD